MFNGFPIIPKIFSLIIFSIKFYKFYQVYLGSVSGSKPCPKLKIYGTSLKDIKYLWYYFNFFIS